MLVSGNEMRTICVSGSARMHAEASQLRVLLISRMYGARGEPSRAQTSLDTEGSES